jgi:signal transduction histidine kinase
MAWVNVLSKTLDDLGRWYVAIPPFLIVAFLAALFFVTGAGQARLQEAGQRLQASAAREHSIDELQDMLSRAVGAQRGYLLTADNSFLARYEKARDAVEPRLENLRAAFSGPGFDTAAIRNLETLIGRRMLDLGMILNVRQREGAPAAIALIKNGDGVDAGLAIIDQLSQLRVQEANEHIEATRHWESSFTLSRWITIIGTILNMLLVAVAARVVFEDLKRRNLLTEELRDQKLRLEKEVEDRTRELVELSTHLQSVSEREKASLARELHDELGGLLVGARMDISWVEQHLAKNDPDMKQRLNRVQQNLSSGVDLKRRIIEELRPTLLDNVGLSAALRWQLKETCRNAGLKCIESYPEEELKFNAEASIALFRIAQEAFTNILKHSEATTVDVSLDLDDETLMMRIADNGKGIPAGRFTAIASHGLASMRHRVRALGGRLEVRSPSSGGTTLLVQIPVANAVISGHVSQDATE